MQFISFFLVPLKKLQAVYGALQMNYFKTATLIGTRGLIQEPQSQH